MIDADRVEDDLEPDDDLIADEEPDVEPEPVEVAPKPSAAEERVRLAAERAEAAERKARELEERLNAMTAQLTSHRTAADEALEQERIRAMSPEERADYRIKQLREENERNLNLIRFQQFDGADQAKFEMARARNPLLDSVADQVETVLAEERRQGRNYSRQVIAAKLLGDKVLADAGKTKTQRAKAAKQSVDDNVVKPTRSGSGVPGRAGGAPSRRGSLSDQELVNWMKSNYING